MSKCVSTQYFFPEIIFTKCLPLLCSNVQYLKLGTYERVRKQNKEAVSILFCAIGLHYASHYFVNYAVKVSCIYFTTNLITKHFDAFDFDLKLNHTVT